MAGQSVSPKPASPDPTASPAQQQGAADPTDEQPIEAATEPGDEDEFDVTEGYDTGSSTGSTSATSSIYAHTYEHGRRYQIFKNGRYPIPNDDIEQNREDMKHAMCLELLDGVLFFAPIGDDPQLILDIGTGTGIWAIDVADRYPSARVCGIDLSPVQPVWVPPNLHFLIDDCEREWLHRDVDFVHFRYMTFVLKDPERVLKYAYESLRPGGWIEMQEPVASPMCDDGTMPDSDPVKRIYDLTHEGFEKFGMDLKIASKLEPLLRNAGFENIQYRTKKAPLTPWAKDPTMRLIGQYQKLALLDFIPVMAGRPLQALGMDNTEIQITAALARRAVEDNSVHRYLKYFFWYAQKPKAAEP